MLVNITFPEFNKAMSMPTRGTGGNILNTASYVIVEQAGDHASGRGLVT